MNTPATLPTTAELIADLPRLNALVAEKCCGYKWMRYYDLEYESPDGPLTRTLCHPDDAWLGAPKYVECDLSSTKECRLRPRGPFKLKGEPFEPAESWADAGEVVERMFNVQAPGHAGPCGLHQLKCCDGKTWTCTFCTDFGYTPTATAHTAPLAISLAALLAVGAAKETA